MKRSIAILFALGGVLFSGQIAKAQPPAGDNQFHFAQSISELPPHDNGDMTNIKYVGDTDQDGKGEFVFLTTNGDSCHFAMYEATGDDTYELVFTFPFEPVYNDLFRDWTAITVGDLNQNGVVEILVGLPVDMLGSLENPNPPRLAVFEWSGTVGENVYGRENGTEPSTIWNFNVPDNFSIVPFQFTLDDIDNDGTTELIADMREPKAVYVISQTLPWDFPLWDIEWYITSDSGDPNYVDHFDGGGFYGSSVGDLDSDGKKEIYVPVWDRLTLNIYECQGPGNFTRETYVKNASPDVDYGAVRGVRVGDVNNDGVNELYYAGTDKDSNGMGHVFAISNVTDVSQIDASSIVDLIVYPTHPNNTTTRAARTAYLTDADNDGNADFMIWGSGNGQLYDVEYSGSGDPLDPNSWTFSVAFDVWDYWATYLPEETINTLSPRFWDGDVCEDMDGDGHKEFVIINYSTDRSIVADDPYIYIVEEGPPSGTRVEADPGNAVVRSFSLEANYPNPFNAATSIRYSVPVTAHVSLKVFDILGAEVRTLVEGVVTAGEHRVVWDGADNSGNPVASGVYLYRLRAAGHVDTRRMTLLK